MSKNYIGSTGIKKIFNLIKNKVYSNLPFIGNFPNQKELLGTTKYTAEYDCMIYVDTVTNSFTFGIISISINDYGVSSYQNPGSQSDLQNGTLFALKKGDSIKVFGSGLKDCNLYIHHK